VFDYKRHMNETTVSRALIVFDMDGVIMDVSRSYREAVRMTARLFFKGAASWENLPDPLFSLADLARIKQSGGLNNDWDLTFLIINLLFTRVQQSLTHQDSNPWTRYIKTIKRCDVADLARFLIEKSNPLSALFDKNGKISNDFITSLYMGDVGSGNVIKQIFQEIYLGKVLFESTYHVQTKVFHEKGLIDQETLLIDPSVFENLSRYHILAIATGRPRIEADYPFHLYNLKKYFTDILTLDDCIQEEQRRFKTDRKTSCLSKPNPFMLDAIASALENKVSGYYYVGDMPDDMMAATKSKSKFIAIGILKSSSDKDRLRRDLERAGADYIIEDFDELAKIVES
jgi:phosphoglycolate phosphatase-like HAD superfamily hydrolase